MALQRFAVETRSEIKGNQLRGYASVFDQYADLGNHLESIAPPAFKRALDDPSTDVRALFNHDPSMLLGRQASGTLRIGTDSHGMEYEVDLPDTSLGRDVRALAERGDLSGSSFAFVPDEDEWSTRSGRRVRTHTSVGRLVDVSPVTFPAYDGATVALRSFHFDQPSGRSRLIRARHRALHAHLGGRDR
jgi:HK97 family phage prohead protease